MKSVYINSDEMFEVFQDEDRYLLSVVVGGVAMYEVQRDMDEEMVAQFKKDPERLLWYVERIRHEAV